ncbi:Uncharacterized protein APZ42_011493 [Daphnia magna]|uniref:Uncharacterized protein n=1 Tax=Daphnia magna TaxID=35525 RepID=A0A162CZ95_9CRUS|nr:Uncharacterized protein APZ42_011493 [Daphnia magna]
MESQKLYASKPFPVIRQRNGETASRHVCNPKWRPDQKAYVAIFHLETTVFIYYFSNKKKQLLTDEHHARKKVTGMCF